MDVSVFGVGIGIDTGQVFVQFLYGGLRCQHGEGFFNGVTVIFRNVGIVTQPLKGRFPVIHHALHVISEFIVIVEAIDVKDFH